MRPGVQLRSAHGKVFNRQKKNKKKKHIYAHTLAEGNQAEKVCEKICRNVSGSTTRYTVIYQIF